MTDAPFTGMAAVNRALAVKAGYSGWCLRFVREAFGIPATSGYGSAKAAWDKTKSRRLDLNPPPGVPVWWDILSGKNAVYDHVAISLGGGVVRSTSVSGGNPGNVRLSDLTARWGMRYLGWSEDLLGRRVWAPPPPSIVTASAEVTRVQDILALAGYYKGDRDGVAGPVYRAAVVAYQRTNGLRQDGVWGPVTNGHYEFTVRLQRTLNHWKAVSPKLRVDGDLGAMTRRAVKQVKTRNGLAPNAVVDQPLLRLLGL